MTDLQKVENQLELALKEIENSKRLNRDILHDYVFEAYRIVKNLNMFVVSNNEALASSSEGVEVCEHPDEAIVMDGDMDYCMICSTRIPKKTDC